MSAVPKKKLCWNCEGNIAREVDNCPFCGVYLHGTEDEDKATLWNPSYQPSDKTEEIPTPIYQIHEGADIEKASPEETEASTEANNQNLFSTQEIFGSLKRDLFPVLFLMMGSIFFLFGAVLFLFSHNGTLTLQWDSSQAHYFLLCSFPLVILGSWLLHKSE